MYDRHGEVAPRTLYGVYKLANEGTARVYWQEDGVASVGLRPFSVYGPGRDQGLTAGPTLAMRGGRPRRAVPHRLRRPDAAPLRSRTSPAPSSRRRAPAGDGAHDVQPRRPGRPRSPTSSPRSRPRCPGAEITFDDAPLPFPDELPAAVVRLAADAARAGRPRDRRGLARRRIVAATATERGGEHGRDARLRPRRRVPDQGEGAVPVRLRRARGGRPARRRLRPPGRDRRSSSRGSSPRAGYMADAYFRASGTGDPRLHVHRARARCC